MKKRTWIMIGVGVVVAAVVIGAISNRGTASAQAALSTSQIGQVTRTTLSSAVESSGSIEANDDTTLSFGMKARWRRSTSMLAARSRRVTY